MTRCGGSDENTNFVRSDAILEPSPYGSANGHSFRPRPPVANVFTQGAGPVKHRDNASPLVFQAIDVAQHGRE